MKQTGAKRIMPNLKVIEGGRNAPVGPYLARKRPPVAGLKLVLNEYQQKTDALRHREVYQGVKIEVWQTAESRGTISASFYTLRHYIVDGQHKQTRKSGFARVDDALRSVRARAHDIPTPRRKRKSPRREIPAKHEAKILESLLSDGLEASCPVCDKAVSRDFMGLSAHLKAHVRKGLITEQEKKTIQSRLQWRRHKVN